MLFSIWKTDPLVNTQGLFCAALCCALVKDTWFLISTVQYLQIHGVKTRFFLPLLSQDTLGCLVKDLGFVLSDHGQAHAFLESLGLFNHKLLVFDSD